VGSADPRLVPVCGSSTNRRGKAAESLNRETRRYLLARRLSRRTAIKKSERQVRRSSNAAIEYGKVAMAATEKTRTRQPVGR
jgi:hypothetical protein